MKVYLAGPYRARAAIKECADNLTAIGFTVEARWLDGDHQGAPDAATDAPIEDRQRWAREDLADIDQADVLVAFTSAGAWALDGTRSPVPSNYGASGGRHIETGYALAHQTPVVLIGQPENVFHWLDAITTCADWHEAVVFLAAMLVDHERNLPRAAEAVAR